MRRSSLVTASLLLLLSGSSPTSAADPPPLAGVRRVVFLGDSITYSGQFIAYVEAFLRLREPELVCEFLNLGLPSETVSGLTEPGHAGGRFPRPVLHERLNRVLEKTKPDLIIACYGMNDGIYHPFSEARFERFKEGMRFLRERAAAYRAKVLHVTPPVFDPMPIKARTLPAGLAEYRQPFEGYDEVLGRYSQWLLSQKEKGWDVVDVHGPMQRYLAEQRKRDPSFRLAEDGVHINATGHWLIARDILLHWGIPAGEIANTISAEQVLRARPGGLEVLQLVQRRQELLKDAWLTATGHRRPDMQNGVPMEEALRQSQEIEVKIRKLLLPAP
jgi:lysophospholipase L1-like esterase